MGTHEPTYLNRPTVFPNSIGDPIEIRSPETTAYNCLAWALGENSAWWEPDAVGFWPENQPASMSVENLSRFFGSLGFVPCAHGELEAGMEKVAFYSRDATTCDHFARQLPNGRWTSKLGSSFDVWHTLAALQGGVYGDVVLYMKRFAAPPF